MYATVDKNGHFTGVVYYEMTQVVQDWHDDMGFTWIVVEKRPEPIGEDGEYGKPTTEELLVERKTELYTLLEQKSKEEELTPVPIGPYVFRGGADSGYALKAWLDGAIYYRDKMPELEITTVDFYDAYGNKVVVPIESDTDLDAWEICMAVRNNAGAVLFKYANLKKLVDEAQSLQEIDAIMNILLGQEQPQEPEVEQEQEQDQNS